MPFAWPFCSECDDEEEEDDEAESVSDYHPLVSSVSCAGAA